MTTKNKDPGAAVRKFRQALADFAETDRPVRARLLAALLRLRPVVTNTAGLSEEQRRRFHRILDRISKHLDLDTWDLAHSLGNVPESWVESVSLELMVLLVDVAAPPGEDEEPPARS